MCSWRERASRRHIAQLLARCANCGLSDRRRGDHASAAPRLAELRAGRDGAEQHGIQVGASVVVVHPAPIPAAPSRPRW
jgi:hypothetical protein